MSSSIVRWRGKSPSHQKEEELLGYLDQLIQECHRVFKEPPEVKRFNNYIEGMILLNWDVLPKTFAIPPGMQVIVDENALDRKILGKARKEHFFLFDRLFLKGIQFETDVFSLSFVFIHHDLPLLDGRIVEVVDRKGCRTFYSSYKFLRQADWVLIPPAALVREYVELVWLVPFLMRVKYFLIPDLEISHPNSHLINYDRFRRRMIMRKRRIKNEKKLEKEEFLKSIVDLAFIKDIGIMGYDREEE
ncbi:hypothetical protein DRP77_03185 [Candidatus Poribacteria bacterium]|nr:MAG: hypothetical protein DRP77_03185 [Candidatus Poribacteria bacterium]